MEMRTEDGEVDEVGEEETKQEEHSPQHLPGKPGELQLDLRSASLLLVRNDVVSSASIFSTESEEIGASNRHNLSLSWFSLGPGYSFVVFSTKKTMETHQKP